MVVILQHFALQSLSFLHYPVCSWLVTCAVITILPVFFVYLKHWTDRSSVCCLSLHAKYQTLKWSKSTLCVVFSVCTVFYFFSASSESGYNFLQLSPACGTAGKKNNRSWLFMLLYPCSNGTKSPKQSVPWLQTRGDKNFSFLRFALFHVTLVWCCCIRGRRNGTIRRIMKPHYIFTELSVHIKVSFWGYYFIFHILVIHTHTFSVNIMSGMLISPHLTMMAWGHQNVM